MEDFIAETRERLGHLPLDDPSCIDGATVITLKHSGTYQWDAFIALGFRGRIYWTSDSGCSCFSFGDTVETVADLSTGSDKELIAAYKKWASGDHNDALTNAERVTAHADIREAIKKFKKESN